MLNLKGPKRLQTTKASRSGAIIFIEEDFEEYKARRKAEDEKLKRYLKHGRLFGNSQYDGQYIRPKLKTVSS